MDAEQIFTDGEQEMLNQTMRFGRWKYVTQNGIPTYFYADKVMDELLGIYTEMTPTQRSDFYVNHIYPGDLGIVGEYTEKLMHSPTEVEYRYIHPKWGVRMVRCFGQMVKEENGMVTTIGMHLDITDKVHLRYQKEQTDHTLAQLTQRLYGFNLTLDVHTGEYSLIEGTGMAEAMSVIRKHVDYRIIVDNLVKTIHPDYRDRYLEHLSFESIKRVADKIGYVDTIEFPVKYANEDKYTWHEITLFIDADGHSSSLVNILGRDVTEAHDKADTEAQLAIERESGKAKTNFLFNMSHDIRTPMNAIIGFTDLLGKHIDDRDLAMNYVQKIQSSNKFLLSLINNVLEMARIESGKVVLEESYWDSKDFNNTLAAVFEAQMKQKGIAFKRSVSVQHTDVFCDGVKLREIFLNILSNALKYTNPGGTVTMDTVELPSEDPAYAVFQTKISDTGIGMSSDFLPHLFDDFSRERTSTESRVIGTGLGMSIVKSLVDLMHGTIEVESTKGVGTTFTITLPHRIATEAERVSLQMKSKIANLDCCRGKRLLLAEDNDLNAEIAITVLQESGFEIERAMDGVECVEMLDESVTGYYDLVLMDIQMPYMNGYDATRAIRKMQNPVKAGIPIVAMTANAFDEDKRNALEAGMNGHLAKPIELPKLLETLAQFLA